MKTRILRILLALCALPLALAAPPVIQAGTPQEGSFSENSFISNSSSLGQITQLEWAPDGSNRLFILRKGGQMRIVKNGTLLSTPFVTLSPVFTNGECGSDGFAFDPNFSENGFIYIFVVESSTVSKVLRYTATGDVGGSKTTILNNLPTNGQFHNGGAMGFGKDGKLYVAIGDNNIGRGVDGALSSAASKILRANKNGSVPTDNPFIDGSGGNNDYVWARGFRNPFSLCFRPLSHPLWLSVAGEAKEQLFLVTERKHGGWNDFEGNQPTTGDFIRPKLQYDSHGSWAGGGVGCITGGCF